MDYLLRFRYNIVDYDLFAAYPTIVDPLFQTGLKAWKWIADGGDASV